MSDDELLGPHIPDRMAYRIGEIADIVGVEPHVLRYWETEFRIRPQRSPSGQRMYRRKDLARFLRIKKLLHEEGYTIAGARKALAADAPHDLAPVPVAARVMPPVAPPQSAESATEESGRSQGTVKPPSLPTLVSATGHPGPAQVPHDRRAPSGSATTSTDHSVGVEAPVVGNVLLAQVAGKAATVALGDLFVTAAAAAAAEPLTKDERASATIRKLEAAKAIDEAALRDTLRHIETLRGRIAATRSRHNLPGDGTRNGGSSTGG